MKNLADDLDKLSTISVLRYLPSAETIGLFFRRKYELSAETKAHINFQMYAHRHQFPGLIFIREVINVVLFWVMSIISPFALLMKAVNMAFLHNREFGIDWAWYVCHFISFCFGSAYIHTLYTLYNTLLCSIKFDSFLFSLCHRHALKV